MDLNKPDSLVDIFDSSLNLEETHFEEGFSEGFSDGLVSGKKEGHDVGLKHGFETGEELGFYRGCIDIWSSMKQVDPDFFKPRIWNNIKKFDESLEKVLQKYLEDPENESINMDDLRLKLKSISAMLNVKLEYNGYPKASDANY